MLLIDIRTFFVHYVIWYKMFFTLTKERIMIKSQLNILILTKFSGYYIIISTAKNTRSSREIWILSTINCLSIKCQIVFIASYLSLHQFYNMGWRNSNTPFSGCYNMCNLIIILLFVFPWASYILSEQKLFKYTISMALYKKVWD